MAKTLPAALVIEKNKINTSSAWLVLLDITLTDATNLYLVQNTEDITYGGQVYTAAPFQLEIIKADSTGSIPSVTLSIGNATRLIQQYLESLNGAVGSSVKITVVNSDNLTEDYSELELNFTVVGAKSNAEWAVFTLGAPNPMRQRFPLEQFLANYCMWVNHYKGLECGYAGALPTCTGSLDDCRIHNNSARFGGHPGLNPNAFKLV